MAHCLLFSHAQLGHNWYNWGFWHLWVHHSLTMPKTGWCPAPIHLCHPLSPWDHTERMKYFSACVPFQLVHFQWRIFTWSIFCFDWSFVIVHLPQYNFIAAVAEESVVLWGTSYKINWDFPSCNGINNFLGTFCNFTKAHTFHQNIGLNWFQPIWEWHRIFNFDGFSCFRRKKLKFFYIICVIF